MTDEEILILIKARDEFSQVAKAARAGLVDLEKDVKRLGGSERAAASGAKELARWHNILAGDARKNEAQVTKLDKSLEELHGTQLKFAGFKGLGKVAGEVGPGAAQFSPLAAGMNQYSAAASRAATTSTAFAASQTKVATAQKEVGRTAQRAGKQISNVGIKTQFTGFQMLRFAAAIGGVQLGISVLATTVISLRNAIISTNAQIETATLQFTTLTGSARVARARIADLINFAKRTPFKVSQIVEASRVLRTFGGDVLDNNKILRQIGDTSAATGADLQNLTFWISRAYSALQDGRPFGEAATRLQELAVLTPEVRREIELLNEQGRNAEAFDVLIGSLSRFTGALEEQSKTWRGATSTAADAARLLLAEGFRPLFEGVRELIFNFGQSSEAGKGFADVLAAISQGLVNVLTPIIRETSSTVKAFAALPPVVQLFAVSLLAVATGGALVVRVLTAMTIALKAQAVVLRGNPWVLAAVAITVGFVVAMRLLHKETDDANEALFDQAKALREIRDISKEDLENQLVDATRILNKAIVERSRAIAELKNEAGSVEQILRVLAGPAFSGPILNDQRRSELEDAQQAHDEAAAVVENYTSKLQLRNELLEKGASAIRAEIQNLEEERDAYLDVRDSLGEINVKLETNQKLTEKEIETLNKVNIAIVESEDALTLLEAQLAFVESATDSTTSSIVDLTEKLREAREALIGLSVGTIAKELSLDLAAIDDEFAQGGFINLEEFLRGTDDLFNRAFALAGDAKRAQEGVDSLADLLTKVTGLGAKAEKTQRAARAGPKGPTPIELLIQELRALADQGGPAIDEAKRKLNEYNRIAEETGDILVVSLIARFFEMGFSISEANSALGVLSARLGALPEIELPELPDLEALFAKQRAEAVSSVDQLGGLLETALKRQAQAVLDTTLSRLAAEREERERLAAEAVAIIENAQVDMSAAVHAGTQTRIRAIVTEAEVLRNTIGAEIAAIQAQLDKLNARDFAHDLEIIDRQLALAFDPRVAQKLLDRREQLVLRHGQQGLRSRLRELKEQLRDAQSVLVDDFKAVLDERSEVLDRSEEIAREAFEATTDQFRIQSEVRRLLLDDEVSEMSRLLNTFVPEWKIAGLSYGEQLIAGIRESGVGSFIKDTMSLLGGVQDSPQNPNSKRNQEIEGIQRLGAQQTGSFAKQYLRDILTEMNVVPSFREGAFARSATLAVVGDRPGGEVIAGTDQLREIMRQEAGNVNVKVYIGNREITDIVRVEVDRETDFQLGRGARLAGGRT